MGNHGSKNKEEHVETRLYCYLRDVLKHYLVLYLSDVDTYFLRLVCKEWNHYFRPLIPHEIGLFFLKYGYWGQYLKLKQKYHLRDATFEILEAIAHGGLYTQWFVLYILFTEKLRKKGGDELGLINCKHNCVAKAASRGHLQFLHLVDFPTTKDKSVCTLAARNNQLEALEQAIKLGYPCEDEVAIRMAFQEHIHILELLKHENLQNAIREAFMHGKVKVLDWAHKENLLKNVTIHRNQFKFVAKESVDWVLKNTTIKIK